MLFYTAYVRSVKYFEDLLMIRKGYCMKVYSTSISSLTEEIFIKLLCTFWGERLIYTHYEGLLTTQIHTADVKP